MMFSILKSILFLPFLLQLQKFREEKLKTIDLNVSNVSKTSHDMENENGYYEAVADGSRLV